MMFSGICAFFLYIFKYHFAVSFANESMCSKFSCEEQLLEKMIRQEIKVEMMQNNIKKTQETIANILEEEIKKTSAEVSQKLESIQSNVMEVVEREKEKNEEILKNAFEGLRSDFTNDMEEGKKMLIKLSENIEKPSVAFFAHNVVDLKLN
ncbi:uncharacterized protein LOC132720631 [Ruditapes philippinarum]|uniref:uncharacterized protein LOC132720631 n=1 Tax=Ruditapes philippinarum TaxID=129788 RepID=UPI00295BA25D|nr:uncharacterized protein LOC132720631 [Ruditapes philippinarum]